MEKEIGRFVKGDRVDMVILQNSNMIILRDFIHAGEYSGFCGRKIEFNICQLQELKNILNKISL